MGLEEEDDQEDPLFGTKLRISSDSFPSETVPVQSVVKARQNGLQHFLKPRVFESKDNDKITEWKSPDENVKIECVKESGIGGNIWKSSEMLYEFLSRRQFINFDGKTVPLHQSRVLELGSGTGHLGIMLAKTAAEIVLTDNAAHVPQIQNNLSLNKDWLEEKKVRVCELDWFNAAAALAANKKIFEKQFDIIVCSDTVYYDSLYAPLLDTIEKLLEISPFAKVVFGFEKRFAHCSRFFLNGLRDSLGLKVSKVTNEVIRELCIEVNPEIWGILYASRYSAK